MSFARPSLAIGHDHSVESIEHIVDHWSSYLRIRLVLARVHLKDAIESEISLVKARPNQ